MNTETSLKGVFPAFCALLKNLFPVLDEAHITDILPAHQVDFKKYNQGYVFVLNLIGEVTEGLVFVTNNPEHGFHQTKLIFGIRDRLQEAGMDLKEAKLNNAGKKSIVATKQDWKENHILISFKINGEESLLFFTYSFFHKIAKCLGLSYAFEFDPYHAKSNFTEGMQKIEESILLSDYTLYFPFEVLLNRLKSEDAAFLINRLLKDKALDHSFLANVCFVYPKVQSLVRKLSTKNREIIDAKLYEIQSHLSDPIEIERWKLQVTYIFQRIVSNYFYPQDISKRPEFRVPGFDTATINGVIPRLNEVRVDFRLARFDYLGTLNALIASKTVNSIINGTGREIFADMIALGHNLPIDELCSLFSTVFRQEFEYTIKKSKDKIQKLVPQERKYFSVEVRKNFLHLLESDYRSKLNAKSDDKSIKTILSSLTDFVRNLSREEVIALYERLSMFDFATLFESFKYLPESSVFGKNADTFFQSVVNHLPTAERTIVEDIYYERINKDRRQSFQRLISKARQIEKELELYAGLGYFSSFKKEEKNV